MSHNHEPERAARKHKPAIIAIAVALLAALIAFWVFQPGGVDEGGDGLASTPPPSDMQSGTVEGTEEEPADPVSPDAGTPADAFEEQQGIEPAQPENAPDTTAPTTTAPATPAPAN